MTRATRFERFHPWWSDMVKAVQSGVEVKIDGQAESEARKFVHQMSSFRLTVQKEQMLAPTPEMGEHMRQLYLAACSVEVQRHRRADGLVDVKFTNRFNTPMMVAAREALRLAAGRRSPASDSEVTPGVTPLPTMALPGLVVEGGGVGGGGDVGSSPGGQPKLPTSDAMEQLLEGKFKL